MAKVNRKRKRKSARRTVTVSAAPRRRRRTRLSTSPRRRKRKRGLSEMNLVKGKMGMYVNPMIEGGAGGAGAMLLRKLTPAKFFDDNLSYKPYEKWIKGGVLIAGSALAAHMKQPLVAAGLAGGAAVLVMQEEGILQEGPAGNFSQGRFADGRLLSNRRLLSDRRLLSEGNNKSLYANYQMLYDRASDEFPY